MPAYCFERLCRILGAFDNGDSIADRKHDAVETTHISIAYLFVKLLHLAHRLPFKLTHSDSRRNLEELLSTPEDHIKDLISFRFFQLHDLGVPLPYFLRCLTLVRDAACTTNMVEQTHGSGACLMRDHGLYEERTLRARSTVHQARSLFRDSEHDQALQTLRRKLASQPFTGLGFCCRLVSDSEVRDLLRDFSHAVPDGCKRSLADRRLVVQQLSSSTSNGF